MIYTKNPTRVNICNLVVDDMVMTYTTQPIDIIDWDDWWDEEQQQDDEEER